mgnify:CR=1 FL=1
MLLWYSIRYDHEEDISILEAFSIVVDDKLEIRFVKFCQRFVGFRGIWNISLIKSILPVSFFWKMRIDAFIILNSYFYRLRESSMIIWRISQYAFSIVVDKNPDLRFVKLCGDLLGLVGTWSISSSKSIWFVVFTRLHGLDYKALLWYICRMEVWFV